MIMHKDMQIIAFVLNPGASVPISFFCDWNGAAQDHDGIITLLCKVLDVDADNIFEYFVVPSILKHYDALAG